MAYAQPNMRQTQTFQSTINGLKFSVPENDENSIRFLNHPEVQPFIVPEHQIQHDKYDEQKQDFSALGEVEIVNNDTPKITQSAKPKSPKPKKTTAPKTETPKVDKGTVELE